MSRWLIVGHGSVGSSLAARVSERGGAVVVYDPSPRVEVRHGVVVAALDPSSGPIDYCISSVPPATASLVPDLVRPVLADCSVVFDWNSVSPAEKLAVSERLPCPVVDVALLDSLDGGDQRPRLAISGPTAERHRLLLVELGFHVDLAGLACGDAALLKFARSIFMKALEGLVLEYAALTSRLEAREIVDASLANNLGDRFMEFADLLVVTNRLHAERRAAELAEACQVMRERDASTRVADAVVPLLERCAELWRAEDGPEESAGLDDLARFLGARL